jgi:hypothetical protein
VRSRVVDDRGCDDDWERAGENDSDRAGDPRR